MFLPRLDYEFYVLLARHRAAVAAVNFQRFDPARLPELMTWFPDAGNNAAPGAATFDSRSRLASFREDCRIEMRSQAGELVDDDAALAAFGQCYVRLERCPFRPPRGVAIDARRRARDTAHPRTHGLGPRGIRRSRTVTVRKTGATSSAYRLVPAGSASAKCPTPGNRRRSWQTRAT